MFAMQRFTAWLTIKGLNTFSAILFRFFSVTFSRSLRALCKEQSSAETQALDSVSKPKNLNKLCSVCEKEFTSREGLNRHKSIHSGARPFSFSICFKSFRQGGHVTEHMQTHSDFRFQCKECSSEFTTKISLNVKRHHDRRHSKNPVAKPIHPCQKCEKTLSRADNLIRHLKVSILNCYFSGKNVDLAVNLNLPCNTAIRNTEI